MYLWFSVIIFILFIVYIAFFWRITWIKDLRESEKSKKKNLSKFISRNRKIGKLPPVYPNGWFALTESSEIKRGKVKHISALGENFAVFRTERGTVNILDAYCPHLGANMAEGGKVKGDCLECPFHGWTFRGSDGRCDRIPYSEKIPLIAKTKAWKSCEVNGIIFVWYHAEEAEPIWQPQSHPLISSGAWRCHGHNEFLINCHIQEIPENGADIAHLSEVHGPFIFLVEWMPWLIHHSWTEVAWAPCCTMLPDTTNDQDTENTSKEKLSDVTVSEENPPSPTVEYKDFNLEEIPDTDNRKQYKHRAAMHLRHRVILFNKIPVIDLEVTVSQIGPGYVELRLDTALGPMYLLQTVTPVEPLLQKVTHQIFSSPLLAPYTKIVFLGKSLMFERDVAVWNHKRFERQPILVSEDRTILAYRRWYSQFYSPRSPTYEDSMKSLNW